MKIYVVRLKLVAETNYTEMCCIYYQIFETFFSYPLPANFYSSVNRCRGQRSVIESVELLGNALEASLKPITY